MPKNVKGNIKYYYCWNTFFFIDIFVNLCWREDRVQQLYFTWVPSYALALWGKLEVNKKRFRCTAVTDTGTRRNAISSTAASNSDTMI